MIMFRTSSELSFVEQNCQCSLNILTVILSKKKNVATYSNMRPISLRNFSNKIISRVLHKRLVDLLPILISSNQAGFVKGMNIVENILLTQEIVSDIRKRGKPSNVVIKLDMAKAYYILSWLFLTKVLRQMVFDEKIIDTVYGLVSNNWYLVLLNGRPLVSSSLQGV